MREPATQPDRERLRQAHEKLLTNLRDASRDDLKQRLYACSDAVTPEPVVRHRTYYIEDPDAAEGVKVTALPEP